ncbi:hypothetical protein Aperf_G00000108122 [Anoplocephala perfoliata]
MFKPGDKVFAKMKGFPFWPARVDNVPEHVEVPKGKLPIFFYGTHQVSFLPVKSLVGFEVNRELHGKRKNLARAMEEIDSDPDILLLGKDPAAEAFWESLYPRLAGTIEQNSEFAAVSGSSSPVPKKVSKRKLSKAPRTQSSKRRKSESKDELNSLSSLSDMEATHHVSTSGVGAQKNEFFSNVGPVGDKTPKVSHTKRRQNVKESGSKRSRLPSSGADIEAEIVGKFGYAGVTAESRNISPVESAWEVIHAKASSDVELTPDKTEISVGIDSNELHETRASGFLRSLLADEADSPDIGNAFVLSSTENPIELVAARRQTPSPLSNSDRKSGEDDSTRVHFVDENEYSPKNPGPSGNSLTREEDDNGSESDASLKKSVDSYPNFGIDSPTDKMFSEIKEPENGEAIMKVNDEDLSDNVENEANQTKSEVSIRETDISPALSSIRNKSPGSDEKEIEVDDPSMGKIEGIKGHKRIRKYSDTQSDNSESSVKSIGVEVATSAQSKRFRKSSHRHQAKSVDTKSESESGRKADKRSDTVGFLRDLVVKLKASLLCGRENFSAAVDVLERVCATEVSLLQLTQVWELTDCIKKCRKYRRSEEVRNAAKKTIAYFQKIQSEASKEEIIKVRAFMEELNRTRHHSSKIPEPVAEESISKQASAVATDGTFISTTVVDGSPVVNSSPDQPPSTGKNKFSLEALRAELDEKANSLLARLAATEARLMADRNKTASIGSNNTTPKIPSASSSSIPRRKVEEAANAALSRVDEVASRLTVDLDACDPVPPPPPPPPLPVQTRVVSRPHQQQQQQVDLDTRISQLMMGVITPATPQARHREPSSSSDQPSAKLLALREQIQRKRKAATAASQKNHEKSNESSKNKSADDVIYDLLGV